MWRNQYVIKNVFKDYAVSVEQIGDAPDKKNVLLVNGAMATTSAFARTSKCLAEHFNVVPAPEFALGYRWDDPTFAIPWPEPVTVISDKDQSLPLFSS